MAEAEVGDDGFGEDPTVARLEEAFAERVGKEAALFVPSGTMANQIALRLLAPPGTAVLAGRRQHVVVREAAARANAAAQLVTLDDADGTLDPAEVARWVADAGRVGGAGGGVRGGHPRRGRRPGLAARAAGRRRPRSGCPCTSTALGSGTPRWRPAPRVGRAGGRARRR